MLVLFALLALAPPATPAPTGAPVEEGPPPPAIVERIDEPSAAPIPLPAVPPPTPTSTPIPRVPTPATPPRPTAATPTPIPASAPPERVAPASEPAVAGGYGVHVASYRRKETADTEANRLQKQLALPARVVRVDLAGKGVWYRVVVGDAASVAEATPLRDAVRAKGFPAAVVVRSR